MLKRIKPSEAELGMFIHKLDGPWLKHPFWKTKFVIKDAESLSDLREAEIEAVVIDIAKGRDVNTLPPPKTVAEPVRGLPIRRFSPPTEPAAFDLRSTAPQSTAREFGHAGKVAQRGRRIVNKVFLEARLGKSIKAEAVGPVIEDIFASIQRNPHAFNGLMRCKRENEHIYRHALACSALMVSLARQLKMSPSEIREAGKVGLLFDVGINHLPVDLALTQGDYRALPEAISRQHTQLGHDFLVASGVAQSVALAALQHHERHDGSGFPNGLIGVDIPLLSRMAAVCDTYDALASEGSAAAPVDPGKVIELMAQMTDKFDPAVFAAFVRCVGTFPIGTFVQLRSDQLAMVIDQHPTEFSRPKVRTFFSLASGKRIRQETIDLATCYGIDEIVRLADLSQCEPGELLDLRQRMLASAAKAG